MMSEVCCCILASLESHAITLQQVLAPAIELAEHGFPVAPVAAHLWGAEVASLKRQGRQLGTAMLQPDGSAPKAGQIQQNPDLATTLRVVAEKGAKAGDQLHFGSSNIVKQVSERLLWCLKDSFPAGC